MENISILRKASGKRNSLPSCHSERSASGVEESVPSLRTAPDPVILSEAKNPFFPLHTVPTPVILSEAKNPFSPLHTVPTPVILSKAKNPFLPLPTSQNKVSYRSHQVGFMELTKAFFFARVQPFNCFSRSKAVNGSVPASSK